MKKNIIKYIYSGTVPFLLLLVGFGFVSCSEDDNQGMAAPIIERIRNTDPTTADSAFVSATLGSTLAIIGNNLATTQQVFLNDYPLGVNPAFTTNTTILVQINDSVPTVATNPNVVNKIRVVTQYGETSMDFQTLPPPPQIMQVKNQFLNSGDELMLYGRYFYFVDTVYFPGEDVFVTSGISTNSTGTTLRVTVPENLDFSEGNSISVVSRSGGSVVNRNTQIYDGLGMIADFDTDGVLGWPWNWGWGLSGEMIRSEQPGIQSLDGNFAGMNQAFPGSFGWNNDKVLNLAAWSGEQFFPTAPTDRFSPGAATSQFDIRFEVAVNTSESIEGLLMQLWYPNASGNELQVNVPISDFVRTTDGEWYTMSVNLSSLTSGNIRLNTYSNFLAGGGDGVKQLRLVVQNSTGSDISAVVGIDNVRVVRANF
ncbi:glycan-binding surface protein [Lunatibacter salilacus]|uniref:glycan-binding surface protein n=1 Tax=Lunatibacter salilacus TaxID=2483804 RepID=UPI00131E20E0|nr:glycan-binding surface protein [Lunatibacter salilacus]